MAQDKYATIYRPDGSFKIARCNFDASAAPTTSDDETQGWQRLSFWLVTSGSFNGQLFYCRDPAAGIWEKCGPDPTGGGSGTVTSVGLALPSIFTVSGSPVTTSGTLTGTLANQDANKVWAGPTTGAAAAPTFRVLVAADLPTHSHSQSDVSGLITDLAGKQPLDSDLTAIAALTTTAFGRGFLPLADETAARSYIGAGTGNGTVTSFSAGDLSPLFTTTEANPTTTPALSFTAVNQNASLVYAGPASGSAAAPTFRALAYADMSGLIQEKLTANRTYFVRTTGDDTTGDGSAGLPWLTITKAVSVVRSLNLAGFAATIDVGAGTFTAAQALGILNGGTATINGAGPTTIISTTSAHCFQVTGNGWTLSNMKLQTTTAGYAILVQNGAVVNVGTMEFGACPAGYAQMFSQAGGIISIPHNTTHTISGGTAFHLFSDNATIIIQGVLSVILGANVTFTDFARSTNGATIQYAITTYTPGAFSVTGRRFHVDSNAIIDTFGSGPNHLPGTVAGINPGGGIYK